MKKLLFLLIVVLALVVPTKAVADIFSDNFNVGWGGPDSLGSDPENRLPINWDRYADIPGNTFMKQSNRGDINLNAMVISQWGSNCGITTYNDYAVAAGATLNISVETMSEGWGWELTGLVGGIFKDAGGTPLGTVLTSLTDTANGVYIGPGWVWVTRNASVVVPDNAVSARFMIENYRVPWDPNTGHGAQNGGIWFDNFVVTPEPMTVCLLGLGALLIRRR
jgi:hypothetical protein